MEFSYSDSSTVTKDILEGAQYNANPGLNATIVYLADTQSVSISSVHIVSVPQAISIASVHIVATMVLNTFKDTGDVTSYRNTRVLVRIRGQAKMIFYCTWISGSFGELIPNPKVQIS